MRRLTLGFAYVWLALSIACGTSKDDAASASGPSDGESTASHASSRPFDSVAPEATDPTPAAEVGASASHPSGALGPPQMNDAGGVMQMNDGADAPLGAGGTAPQLDAGLEAGSAGRTGGSGESNGPARPIEPATPADVIAACERACASFEVACEVPCPETCEDYVARVPDACTTQSRDMFDCFAALDPNGFRVFDCASSDNQTLPLNIGACYAEITDTYLCDDYGGAFCRPGGVSEEAYCAEDPRAFGPIAYSCVAAAAPEQCSRVPNSGGTYCCPEDFDFPKEVLLE